MQEIKITFETPKGVDKINHFDLQSDFISGACVNVVFKPDGMTNAEPEQWSIECNTIDGEYLDHYRYDSKEKYEQDIKLLEIFSAQIGKGNKVLDNDIRKIAELNNFSIECYGKECAGEHLIILTKNDGQKMSFLADYWQEKIGYYICVYSDLK